MLKNLVFTLGVSGSPEALKDQERHGERCGMCMCSGILLSHERDEIGSSVEMWVELGPIKQSEVHQGKQVYISAHMWNLEKWYILAGQE